MYVCKYRYMCIYVHACILRDSRTQKQAAMLLWTTHALPPECICVILYI